MSTKATFNSYKIKRRCFALFILLLLLTGYCAQAQIVVRPAQTALTLARALVGNGITIANPQLTCPSMANGLFISRSTPLGIDSGIVLTTGRAASSLGYIGVDGYADILASSSNGAPGDTSLDNLSGQRTIDACALEFDIYPQGDTVSVDYVFSSEEYKNAVCGPYNDVFGFFISGPGVSGERNIALVPGTDIPVTINTINNGIPGTEGELINCTSMGAGSPFTAFYINNSSGIRLTHHGLTTVLRAVQPVTPCGRYHFRMAVADAGNAKYDSGVFLKAGSLRADNFRLVAVPSAVSNGGAVCIKGCLPGRFQVRTKQVRAVPQVLRLVTAGSAVRGVDYTITADSVTIPAYDTAAFVTVTGLPTPLNGARELKMYILSPASCSGLTSTIDSAVMNIYDTAMVKVSPADTVVCGRDSVYMSVIGPQLYAYNWQPAAYLSNTTIKEPSARPVADVVYTVTASLPGTTCPVRSATVACVIKLTPGIFFTTDTTVCFHASFSMTPSFSRPNDHYVYQWRGPLDFSGTDLPLVIDSATRAHEGVYRFTVTNDTNGCSASYSLNLKVNTPDSPVLDPLKRICLNAPQASLYAPGNQVKWYEGRALISSGSSPLINTDSLQVRNFTVTQTIGSCESPASPVVVSVERCCDGRIFIPTAFTPNNDGRNDRFTIYPGYGYYLENAFIYNRWGQVVFSGNTGSWDGTFAGQDAAAGVYFYRLHFGCIMGGNEVRTGEVTLIR